MLRDGARLSSIRIAETPDPLITIIFRSLERERGPPSPPLHHTTELVLTERRFSSKLTPIDEASLDERH
jgi:hypothetical protein